MRIGFLTALILFLGMTTPLIAADEPSFVVIDSTEFARLVDPAAKVEKLAGGMKFLEGPVWLKPGYLVFSDIAGNQLNKWTADGGVMPFRHPSASANGNTTDNQGRLVTCAQDLRAVIRTEPDGSITVLADRFEGKRFNSPNDVVVKSDGSIWFTDPPYGVPKGQLRELDNQCVYRIDPGTRRVSAVVTDMDMPNGLCFTPDEKQIYIADSGKPRHVRIYDVSPDNSTGNGRLFCKIDKGVPDGMRVDQNGRLWSSAGDGIQIFAPDGKLIGKILVPETPANLCFGGASGHTLFITARTSLYKIGVKVGPTR
jgi:gluconolactonase